jgi:hypothetical protein
MKSSIFPCMVCPLDDRFAAMPATPRSPRNWLRKVLWRQFQHANGQNKRIRDRDREVV